MKQVFFNGKPYTGKAAYINGSNGYTCTEDHGFLCALIIPEGPFEHVRSCWDKNGNPNYLTTETGEKIENRGATGIIIEFEDGFETARFRQRMNESKQDKLVEAIKNSIKQVLNEGSRKTMHTKKPVNESLINIISECITKVLKENQDREDVYTINIFDINNEKSIDDMRYTVDYATADEAINAARQAAKQYSNYDDVINVFVMVGEYRDANGNVFGEPYDIYCISNKDKNTTIEARREAGFTNLEVDEYIGEAHGDALLESAIRKSIANVLNSAALKK